MELNNHYMIWDPEVREDEIEGLKQEIRDEWIQSLGDSEECKTECEAEIERRIDEAVDRGNRKGHDVADEWMRSDESTDEGDPTYAGVVGWEDRVERD